MSNYDPIDWLLHITLGPIAARWHRRKFAKRQSPNGPCLYCLYTEWVNGKSTSIRLKLGVHPCVEGKSPAAPLPEARVRR